MSLAPTTVVFDLDGTLIDSAPDLAGALNAVLVEQGLPPLSLDSVRAMVGEGAVKMIERGLAAAGMTMDDGLSDSLRDSFLVHYRARMTERTRPFPGVVAALETLRDAGTALAVCTNKRMDFTVPILDGLDLARFFGAVIGGDSLAVAKPDPAPLRAAIEGAGGSSGGAVMVGDSDIDVATARAVGVPVIAVSFGYTRVPPRELGADAVIDHFDELADALAHINGDKQ